MTIYEFNGIRPTLGENVWIAPTGALIGDVVMGERSSLWFGAVIRGDVYPIRIGSRTNIQDNAIVHVSGGQAPTNIGDDVTIGHTALIHGCTIGNLCLIGMGATVLDGAVIEAECLIGAGALVTPRTHIPKRSLVMGRPGKVVRQLTDADVDHILASAAVYVENARMFASTLRAL